MLEPTDFKIKEVIMTAEFYGVLESVSYLNMSKFRRKFGKSERAQFKYKSQNILEDLIVQAGSMSTLTKIFYYIANFLPSLFAWQSIYILEKK